MWLPEKSDTRLAYISLIGDLNITFGKWKETNYPYAQYQQEKKKQAWKHTYFLIM